MERSTGQLKINAMILAILTRRTGSRASVAADAKLTRFQRCAIAFCRLQTGTVITVHVTASTIFTTIAVERPQTTTQRTVSASASMLCTTPPARQTLQNQTGVTLTALAFAIQQLMSALVRLPTGTQLIAHANATFGRKQVVPQLRWRLQPQFATPETAVQGILSMRQTAVAPSTR